MCGYFHFSYPPKIIKGTEITPSTKNIQILICIHVSISRTFGEIIAYHWVKVFFSKKMNSVENKISDPCLRNSVTHKVPHICIQPQILLKLIRVRGEFTNDILSWKDHVHETNSARKHYQIQMTRLYIYMTKGEWIKNLEAIL